MKRVTLLVAGVLLFGTGCDSDKSVLNPDPTIRISGTVKSVICYSSGNIVPYTIKYRRYASLRFIRDDGKTFFTQTDDSSEYAVSVDTGMYSIILETGHTYPDTARDIRLVRDTVMSVFVKLDYLSADTFNLNFFYRNKSDSLGKSAETQFMTKLNGQLDSVFRLGEALRVVHKSIYNNSLFINYRTPVRDGTQLWFVRESIKYLIDKGIVIPPASFSAYPDVIGCPAE